MWAVYQVRVLSYPQELSLSNGTEYEVHLIGFQLHIRPPLDEVASVECSTCIRVNIVGVEKIRWW